MTATKKNKTYAQMTEELNEIIEWFEGDNVNMEDAINKYEQAVKLLKQMEDYLKTAENRIKKIQLDFDR